jgi:PKD repeat protein
MKTKIISVSIVLLLLILGMIQSISAIPNYDKVKINYNNAECYGYIIKVDSTQSYSSQTNISILVNQLLEQNISVYWTCSNINILSEELTIEANFDTRSFEKGCFIVPFTNDYIKDSRATVIIYDCYMNKEIDIFKIKQPINNIQVYFLEKPEIVYFVPDAGDFLCYYKILKDGGFQNHYFLNREDILAGKLTDDYNVIIHGGGWFGGYAFLLVAGQYFNPSTAIINMRIKKFIENGAGYVGSCGGLMLAGSGVRNPPCFPLDLGSWGLKLYPSYAQLGIIDMPVHRALPGVTGDTIKPGTGVDVRIVDYDSPVSFGLPEIIENHEYYCGPMYLEKKIGSTNAKPLGVIEHVDKSELILNNNTMGLVSWWHNKFLSDSYKDSLVDRWINCSLGGIIWATSEYGRGKAVAFGGHPEQTGGNDPPRLIYNSVFWGASKGPMYINVYKEKYLSMQDIIIDNPSQGNISESICFNGKVTGNSEIDCWIWSFGDGSKSLAINPTHEYSDHGEYNIVLTVADDSNILVNISSISILGDLQVITDIYNTYNDTFTDFSAIAEGGFEPYSWHWDFGDGNISNKASPVYAYDDIGVYLGNITAVDRYGISATCPLVVIVNYEDNDFNVVFNTSLTDRGNIHENIIFTAEVEGVQDSVMYNFSFGDGTYFETDLIDTYCYSLGHCYDKPGIYYATLTVSNASGKIYADCEKVYINSPPNKPEIAINSDIQIGDSKIYIGESYVFNLKTVDPDGDKIWYSINWSKKTYNHTYYPVDSGKTYMVRDVRMVDGEYRIEFKAVDTFGAESEIAVYNSTIEKGPIFNKPLYLFLRFLIKHPNSFPIFRMIFSTEIFEY